MVAVRDLSPVPMPQRAAIESFLSLPSIDNIQLAAIPAEGGAPTCKWFGSAVGEAAAWAVKLNAAGHGIYWSVNSLQPGLNRKATKADVVGVRFAHVDIDPPKQGAFDKSKLILDLELRGASEPTLVIDSGGGIQAFWRLKGNADQGEIEALNHAIAATFGGDNCWNIDRLMRVPGTVNWPNRNKRAAGRTPVLAKVVSKCSGQYSLADLAGVFGSKCGGEAQPKLGSHCLLEKVGARPGSALYRLLADPSGRDRSSDVFAAACELLRHSVDDATMMSVLTNPDLPISSHCLDQPDPARAARRAIEKARREVAPTLSLATSQSLPSVSARPYQWPDPHSIAQRRWLYGCQLLRGSLGLLVAPGGIGKSALTVGMALSLATGRPLLGKDVNDGPLSVWLWNLEDARDELDRAIAAACQWYEISPEDAADRLFVNSALDGDGLCTATQTRQGFAILQPVYDALLVEIRARRIDVLIVDPFVSSHAVIENDNGAIDAVAKAWARVGAAADCAILLVHHTSKSAGLEITAERSRGAVALVNAARSVVALNRMTEDEARQLGVSGSDRRRCFRAYDDKNNRAPPVESSDWYRLETVYLPNGDGEECFGDSVGVVVPWTPPVAAAEVLDPALVSELQQLIKAGEWREHELAVPWAGTAIAEVFGYNEHVKSDRAIIKSILKACLRNGWLRTELRKDAKRRERPWILVGKTVIGGPTDGPKELMLQCSSSAPDEGGTNRTAVTPMVHRSSTSPLGGTGSGAPGGVALK